MSYPSLVCPFEERLLPRLRGRRVVLRVTDPDAVVAAAAAVRGAGAELERLVLELDGPLAGLAPDAAWGGIPLDVRVPATGPFRDLIPVLEPLRRLRARVVLDGARRESPREARVLASVGVPCVVELDSRVPDWDAMADLMTYAVLGRVPRAPVEPFTGIAERYHPNAYTSWGRERFDDPARYLHLDAEGRVALSASHQAAGEFLAESLDALGDPDAHPGVREGREAWREHFLANDACARCPGWKVCLGRVAPPEGEPEACATLFAEMMDVAELHQAARARQDG